MANAARRVSGSAPGKWFVDTTCIDCDACRQIAPAIFGEGRGASVVQRQPSNGVETVEALRALIACPVGAIGTEEPIQVRTDLFPQPVAPESTVFYCGFNAETSYGANSFFALHPQGNVLVDAPRWSRHLVRELEKRGGLADILLTHRDDVADAERYQRAFGSRVWVHEADRGSAPFATHHLKGEEPVTIKEKLLAIPIPGHTRGSVAYLLEERFLFSGDSLYWSRGRQTLAASSEYCWYSWERQLRSLRRLAEFRFEWVLAGHGDRARRPPSEMRSRLLKLVEEAGG